MTGSLPCTWQSMGPFFHQKINFSEPLNFGCVAVECFTSSLFYLLAIPKYVHATFRISTPVPLYENPWSFQSSQFPESQTNWIRFAQKSADVNFTTSGKSKTALQSIMARLGWRLSHRCSRTDPRLCQGGVEFPTHTLGPHLNAYPRSYVALLPSPSSRC